MKRKLTITILTVAALAAGVAATEPQTQPATVAQLQAQVAKLQETVDDLRETVEELQAEVNVLRDKPGATASPAANAGKKNMTPAETAAHKLRLQKQVEKYERQVAAMTAQIAAIKKKPVSAKGKSQVDGCYNVIAYGSIAEKNRAIEEATVELDLAKEKLAKAKAKLEAFTRGD